MNYFILKLQKIHRIIFWIFLALLVFISVLGIHLLSIERAISSEQTAQLICTTTPNLNSKELSKKGMDNYNNRRFDAAIDCWQKAISAYGKPGNQTEETINEINEIKINLAQAEQELGLFPRACNTLVQIYGWDDCEALRKEAEKLKQEEEKCKQKENKCEQAKKFSDILEERANSLAKITSPAKITGLHSLGNVLQKLGELDVSHNVLKLSLNMDKAQKAAILLDLGNTRRALSKKEQDLYERSQKEEYLNSAIAYAYATQYTYDQVIKNTNSTSNSEQFIQIQAKLNQLSFALDFRKWLVKVETEKFKSETKEEKILEHLCKELSKIFSDEEVKDKNYQNQLADFKSKGTDKWFAEQFSNLIPVQNIRNLKQQIENLTLNHTSLYIRLNFAKNLIRLISLKDLPDVTQTIKSDIETTKNIENIIEPFLKCTIKKAQNNGDSAAESYALGYLGEFYKYCKKWEFAQKKTEEALYLAQSIRAKEITYQWQWQMGDLLRNQSEQADKREKAIESYKAAINTLESVRDDLIAINSDVQFLFRDEIEPIYRDLVNLLLTNQGGKSPNSDNIKDAIKTIDNLQLAELIDFTRCKDPNLVTVENFTTPEKAEKSAIIYPILLKENLVTIYELPGEKEPYYPTQQEPHSARKEVEETIASLRTNLQTSGRTPEVIADSEKLYQLIIKPVEVKLKEKAIKTLVFVLDGSLRNIPMSVLYDKKNKQYLIDKGYAATVAPRLKLFSPDFSKYSNNSPQKTRRQQLNVFTGGVGEGQTVYDCLFLNCNYRFNPINKLTDELYGIAKFVNADKPLLNKNFTKQTIEKRLKNSKISAIHWKTHGEFSSDPEKTYIVASNELIKAKDLNNLIQTGSKKGTTPLELIVLSACETAKGDNQAVLGLAGIAARTGARSVISTLWRAEDEPNTQFMIRFYQELLSKNPGMTKAKAVLEAQKALKDEYKDTPYVWANYILIGNWL